MTSGHRQARKGAAARQARRVYAYFKTRSWDTEVPPEVSAEHHPSHHTDALITDTLRLDFSENVLALPAFRKWLESGQAWADFGTWADLNGE